MPRIKAVALNAVPEAKVACAMLGGGAAWATTTVAGLTPCCRAHSLTEGNRVPGASSLARMRCAKRAASCSVNG